MDCAGYSFSCQKITTSRKNGTLTRALAARRLWTAALEKRRQAWSSSDIALDASAERGPRVTIVPNTTCQRKVSKMISHRKRGGGTTHSSRERESPHRPEARTKCRLNCKVISNRPKDRGRCPVGSQERCSERTPKRVDGMIDDSLSEETPMYV